MLKVTIKTGWIFIFLPAVLFLSTIHLHFKKDLVFFPGETNLEFTSYLDTAGSGQPNGTIISRFHYDSTAIDIEYTCGSRNIYPYAGFQWIVKPDQPFIDISDYDHLTLTIDTSTTEEIIILILQFFIDGFSSLQDRMTWRYLTLELPVKEGKASYTIPLKKFQTPIWWYNQFKTTEKELGQPDFSSLGVVSVEEGSDEVGVSKRMVAKGLRFQKKSGSLRAVVISGIVVLYYIVLLIIVMIRKRLAVRRIPVVIPYEKINLDGEMQDDEQRVFEYLGNHFSDQTLSLSKMSDEIGVSASKISLIIKRKYDLSFRQYLNTIRISEAKRMLQETRLQISQIAYKVGYTNLTHFCRTFKEVTSVSPNTFRQELSDSKIETDT
jgi:AraC-like DNA-binding protein